MLNPISLLKCLVVVAVLIPPGRAAAQQSRDNWLEDCRNNRDGSRGHRESFCEVREVRAAAPRGPISMEGLRNGGVRVTGWEKDSLIVRTMVRATGRTQPEARALASKVRTVVSGANVRVEGPRSDDDQQWSASLQVMVPRRSDIRVETRNGPVSVEQVVSDMNLITSNGPMSLRDVGGSVRARTTNGPLSISLSGTRWDGAGIDARTTNGPLTMAVPDGYNARLEAGTTNGPVNLGFPITVVGRITRDISTVLGSGGATIRASTTNGPLTIRRR